MKTSIATSILSATLGAALAGVPAAAQQTVYWAAPAAPTTGQQAVFPIGTPLKLISRTDLSTKHNRPGEQFYLEVAEPLTFRDQVVVPTGAIAVGEIARSQGNGALGKRGTLGIRLLHVQTPQGPIRLTGRSERSGTGRGVLAIGGGVLLAWPMLFIHGGEGKLPAGTPVTAQLLDDLRFPVAAPARTVAAR